MPYSTRPLNAPRLTSLACDSPRRLVPPRKYPREFSRMGGGLTNPIDELRAAIGPADGKVLVPGIDPIPEYQLPFNLRTVVVPRVLLQAKTSIAVRESIAWANRHGIPLCGHGGGHSYEGFSSIAGLVIDVGDMDRIAVDTVRQTATIGAGCRLGNVAERLFPRWFGDTCWNMRASRHCRARAGWRPRSIISQVWFDDRQLDSSSLD